MILASLGDPKKEGQPKLNVREEGYNNASILVIEAPGVLEKVLGDWAKDVALTVAVTDQWLVVGTSVSGIKQTLNTAGGNGTNLATAMKQQGETVPAGPVTRWGVICPSSGADIVLAFAEKLAGRERVEQAKKLINLVELLKLVKRFSWERTDGEDLVRGRADIQATN
jgi:ABC-type taurine transport system ATPase subunit